MNDAKAYVKKPKPGKAARPFHNKRPPTTTLRGNKRPRPEDDVEDGFATRSPAPPPNTGNGSPHMVLSRKKLRKILGTGSWPSDVFLNI